ncbi:MAG: cyclase family protein [Burkholderiales bacterium]
MILRPMSQLMVGALAFVCTLTFAQTWKPPSPEQRCPSKWGAADERGAANLMGPETVLRATKLIKTGKVYELGKELSAAIPFFGERRFSMQLKRTTPPAATNQQRSNEEIVTTELGQVGTQFDALNHQGIADMLYNCVKIDDVATRNGFTKLGVEKVGGLFTRGVLIDVAALKGVEMLAIDYEITEQDLRDALTKQGVMLGAGDAALIHTGWGLLYGKENAKFVSGEPGIGASAAEWLAKQNVMLIGSDNWAIEIFPNPDKQIRLPVHAIALVINGIFLLENLELEALAKDKAYEFALVVEPLKIKGGTGSTVAPIAVR